MILTNEEALKLGLDSPEETTATPGKASVFAREALKGLTFGNLDPAAPGGADIYGQQYSPEYRKALLDKYNRGSAENPWTAIAGRMAGELPGFIAGGEILEPIRGAGAVADFSKLGKTLFTSIPLGAGYGAVKKLEGDESRLGAIASNAATFAAFDVGLAGLGKLFKHFTKAKDIIAKAHPSNVDVLNGALDVYRTEGKDVALEHISKLQKDGLVNDAEVNSLLGRIREMDELAGAEERLNKLTIEKDAAVNNIMAKGYTRAKANKYWDDIFAGKLQESDVPIKKGTTGRERGQLIRSKLQKIRDKGKSQKELEKQAETDYSKWWELQDKNKKLDWKYRGAVKERIAKNSEEYKIRKQEALNRYKQGETNFAQYKKELADLEELSARVQPKVKKARERGELIRQKMLEKRGLTEKPKETPKIQIVETQKVNLPEFTAKTIDTESAAYGKSIIGKKEEISALKEKIGALKNDLKTGRTPEKIHVKRMYEEALEVAEGKMPEVTPGVKEATVKKPIARRPATKASTVNGWIKNQGGIKRKDLELYGIEDTNTKMLIGKNAADDLGARAVEEGVIPKPPKDMPLSDWLMEHRGKKAYEAIEHKTDKAIYESPEYVDYQYEELGKRGAIADDLTKDKFAEMLKKNKEPETVHTGDLGVGDEFTIAGEKFKVTKQVGNELELKDGITKRVPDTFSEVTIDRGSLKKSAQKPKTSKEMEFYNEQVKKGRVPSMGKSLTPEERATAIAKRKAKLEKTGQKDVFGEAPGQGQKDIFGKPEMGGASGGLADFPKPSKTGNKLKDMLEEKKIRGKGRLERWLLGDPIKEETKTITASRISRMRHEMAVASEQMKKEIKWFEKRPVEENLKLIDDIETGKEVAPELKEYAKQWRKMMDESYNMGNSVDNLSYRENYFPHIFEQPKKIRGFLKKWNRNPAFKKGRKFPTIKDALDWAKENNIDLKLKTTNPAELILERRMAGYQHKFAKDLMQDLKNAGLIKFVRAGRHGKEGFEPLKGDYFTVFFPTKRGTVIAGKWEALPEAKKILDNFFSTGLWGDPTMKGKVFRSMSGAKNFVVALKLGLSGFHVVETGVSSVANQLQIALRQMARGEFSLGEFAKGMRGIKYGGELLDAWKLDKPYYLDVGGKKVNVIELVKRGGGDLSISKEWMYGVEDKFNQALKEFRAGHKFKGSLTMIPGLVEKISTPIMQKWVPRLKANAYMRQAVQTIKENPNMTEKQLNKALFKVWDTVDNSFGQLIYDKLFWNRTLKDLGVLSQLSMGWNIGTARQFGGGAIDLAKYVTGKVTGKEANIIKDRMMYAATYTIGFGMLGALMTKAMTGENPKEIRDYFYPRTGGVLANGADERLQMPTMLKEVMSSREAFRKNGVVAGVPMYAWHKINPLLSMMIDLAKNKDYYGVEIADNNADVLTNIKQYAEYFGTQGLVPISVSGMSKHYKTTGKISPLPLFGFNPAPGYVTKNKIQKEIFDAYGNQIGNPERTKAEYEKYKKKAEVKVMIQKNKIKDAQARFYELKREGVIGNRVKWYTFLKRYTTPSDIRVFGLLSKERQKKLLAMMTEEDKLRYEPYIKRKRTIRRRTR